MITMRARARRFVAGMTASLAAAVGAMVAPSPARAAEPVDGGVAAATAIPEFPGMVAAFRRLHPTVSEKDAIDRVSRQHVWIRLVDDLSGRHPGAFGGSWYDGDTDTLHLQVVGAAAEAPFRSAAAAAGVQVALHRARYSLRELEAQFHALASGRHALLGAAAKGSAGIDVRANRAVVAVARADVAALRGRLGDGPVAVVERNPTGMVRQVCSNRWQCGRPLRTGVALWESPSTWESTPFTGKCSLGFTATATEPGQAATHWVLTAGHCGPFTNPAGCATVCWRHGEQPIGPMRQTACAAGCGYERTAADVGRIRIESSYWLGGGFGWMFNGADPDSPIAVRQRAAQYGQVPMGATVCLNAQWSHATNGLLNCGELALSADSDAGGLARVNGVSGCDKDSGGGWYMPNNGQRRALGIHTGANRPAFDPLNPGPLCRMGGPEWRSWFSALPAIDYLFDTTTTATIRVDIR